ncbi:alpha/beta hydrolase family protein [Salipaludibacillus sp. HK11]|uniref:alpha/beta hydrolase family protein n=1 Tax=Salipaludibacillus sp. HK11 TaxID=3394320 RepID=UPI0039FD8901
MWNLDNFYEEIYENTVSKQKIFSSTERYRFHLKQSLTEALGKFPERPNDFKLEKLEIREFEQYTREKISISSILGLSIPIYILTPKNMMEKHSSVLALHGHGYGSKEIVGMKEDGSEDEEPPGIHKHFAIELVKRGVKVFAPEVVGFGDRMLSRDIENKLPSSCYALATQLLMCGQTLPGLRVNETLRVLDLVMSLEDVDENRVGIMGFSGGGLIAAYSSALDERIKATVLTGFTNTFKGSILAIRHCLDNYLPGILESAELPDIIGLIAPRPLFVEAAIDDPIFPIQSTRQAIKCLEETYRKQHATNNITTDVFRGNHMINGRYSYDWLVEELSSK